MATSVAVAAIGAHAVKAEHKPLVDKAVYWNVVNNIGIIIGCFAP